MGDIIVKVMWDEEAEVWIAICDDLGLALESESYDRLIDRVIEAAPEMAQLRSLECTSINISTCDHRYLIDPHKNRSNETNMVKYWIYEIEMSEEAKKKCDEVRDICGLNTYDELFSTTIQYVIHLAESDPDGLQKAISEIKEHPEDTLDIKIIKEYPDYNEISDEHMIKRKESDEA